MSIEFGNSEMRDSTAKTSEKCEFIEGFLCRIHISSGHRERGTSKEVFFFTFPWELTNKFVIHG